MGKGKAPDEPLETFLDPLKFYNHGDNPAMKNFMKIAMANAQDGKVIDHRTYVIDQGQRLFWARNWDDFLQRDLKAITFPRAFGVFFANSLALFTVAMWSRHLLPIGRFGIRNIGQTTFYRNFGPIGVAGVGAMLFAGCYTEWQTFKFTLHKFYRHVLMGERNWLLEETKNCYYGEYEYKENMLANENNFVKSDPDKYIKSQPRKFEPSFKGVYGDPN